MRTIQTLDLDDARRAMDAMRAQLLAEGRAAVICVADAHGDVLALERLDGAPASSVRIASNKAWTAASEGKPTRDIGRRVRSADDGFDIAYYGDTRAIGWGGGLPVIFAGVVVGSVAVSGLPEDEDERIARVGVQAVAAIDRA